MSVININADQNQNTAVEINDATAATNERVLLLFYADGVNVFNKAVPALGGDIVITAATKYAFNITAQEALKLNGVENTYKLYLVPADDQTSVSVKHNGNVTVEPLAAEPGETPIRNIVRYNWRLINQGNKYLLPSDELLIFNFDDPESNDFELGHPAEYSGMGIIINNACAHTIDFNWDDGEPQTLEFPLESSGFIFCDGDSWILLFQ